MASSTSIVIDDVEFNRVVLGGLPDCGDDHFAFVVKENGTESGTPVVCITGITMTSQGPKRHQHVTTVKNLMEVFRHLHARYAYLIADPILETPQYKQKAGYASNKVGWNAGFMESIWLITTDNGALGFTQVESEVVELAETLCVKAEKKQT